MIKINSLTVQKNNKKILDQVSCRINKGFLTAILGPNGAGKSTLIRNIAGLEEEGRSVVRIQQRAICEYSLTERGRLISWLSPTSSIPFTFPIKDLVMMGRYPWHYGNPVKKDWDIVYHSLERLSLFEKRNENFDYLSSGEQKKVMIARVLAQNTPLVLLDEPCSHLDLEAVLKLFEILEAEVGKGKTVCICLHDISLAKRYASKVVVLKDAKLIAEGSIKAVLDSRLIEETFNVKASFHQLGSEEIILTKL